ncbi:unnamed protein product, partial [Ilex paraguariensis]
RHGSQHPNRLRDAAQRMMMAKADLNNIVNHIRCFSRYSTTTPDLGSISRARSDRTERTRAARRSPSCSIEPATARHDARSRCCPGRSATETSHDCENATTARYSNTATASSCVPATRSSTSTSTSHPKCHGATFGGSISLSRTETANIRLRLLQRHNLRATFRHTRPQVFKTTLTTTATTQPAESRPDSTRQVDEVNEYARYSPVLSSWAKQRSLPDDSETESEHGIDYQIPETDYIDPNDPRSTMPTLEEAVARSEKSRPVKKHSERPRRG